MKVLCIGGHNDGKMVEIDPLKRDGETYSLSYRVPLKADSLTAGWSMADDDTKLTFSEEKYTVRNIYFTPGGRVTVLVIDGREEIPQILQDLVDGYRKPKVQI